MSFARTEELGLHCAMLLSDAELSHVCLQAHQLVQVLWPRSPREAFSVT